MHTTGDLTADTICRTIEFGLTISGEDAEEHLTPIGSVPIGVTTTCQECTQLGNLGYHVICNLVPVPVVGHPTRLPIRLP